MSDVTDLRDTIVPKSDQINADDLIAGPIDVTVKAVRRGAGDDQPIDVHLEGMSRTFRPCKTMRRVLITLWTNNGAAWVGRRMRLYRDPEVEWGKAKVGGVRISHVSHIEARTVLVMTVKRGQRREFIIDPMPAEAPPVAAPTPSQRATNPDTEYLKAHPDQELVRALRRELFGDRKLVAADVVALADAVRKQTPPPAERAPGDEDVDGPNPFDE